MKSKLAVVGVPLIAAIALVLSASRVSAEDPIPGVDVKLGRNPGGIVIQTVETDKKGHYVFDELGKDEYKITCELKVNKAIVSTTRSNIKHKISVVDDVEVHELNIEFGGPEKETKPHKPFVVTVSKNKAKISGTVTKWVAPKKNDVK